MKYLIGSLLIFFSISSNAQKDLNTTTYTKVSGLINNLKFDPDTIFCPLNSNNQWQYLISSEDPDGLSYDLEDLNVIADTLIGNFKYYELDGIYSNLIRYSKPEQKLFVRWNDSDYINVDFTIPDGMPYQSFIGTHFKTVYSEAGEDFQFGRNRAYEGYLYLESGWGSKILFADSIGIYYRREAGSYLSSTYNIIAAILYDSSGHLLEYSDHKKPSFQLTPITTINSQDFNLNFKVLHPYTRILSGTPPPWHQGLDFIDSVKMDGYYSNNDSIITISPVYPIHNSDPVNNDFSVSLQLDTSLMKNGYSFYYRFWAKDRCIIPELAFSPDSGYYICSWDQTAETYSNTDATLIEFSLSQNFPNPFNPATTIKYSIPSTGVSFTKLKIYNSLGEEIATLVNEIKSPGTYEVNFDGSRLPSGVYIYRLTAGNLSLAKKLILMK
jgi:hypothetical protein